MLKLLSRFNTIKNKILFSYVLLLIIPLSLVAMVNYIKSANILEEKAVEQFDTVSQLANQQFDQFFIDIDNLSKNIFQSSVVQRHLTQPFVPSNEYYRGEVEISAFLKRICDLKPDISSIVIYGSNNRNYYYHPKRRWNSSYDGTQEQWYQEAVAKDGAWVLSGPREDRQLYNKFDKRPEQVVTFSRVIKNLKTLDPIGVLAINVEIETLEHLTGVDTGENNLVILDKEGKPVVASEELSKWENRDELLQVSTVSPVTGWTSTYFADKTELVKESKHIRNFMMGLTVLLLVMALFLANYISSGIVKPLSRLKLKMKDVEKGNFNSWQAVPVSQRDEVGELTQGFNHMVEQIEALVNEIQERERQKRETELSALQARINPHFMYNTLNGMRWMALMEGNQRLAELISSFVYLLKFSAKNQDNLITLEHETRLLKYYVDLMKMRHEPFEFRIRMDECMNDHKVVPFLLQPIVENAIFHGIAPLKRKGNIDVDLYVQDGMNVAVVRDDGVGMEQKRTESLLSDEQKDGHGEHFNKIGLKNVCDRLRLQFGSPASLDVTSKPGCGTEVRVIWPITVRK